MKKFRYVILLFCLIPCVFLFSACSFFATEKVYVTDIVKTEVVGDTATYTVYYSNGETSILTVDKGRDGVDGDDFTLEMLQEYSVQKGYDDFDEFLKDYLSVSYEKDDVQDATNTAIQSAVTVWCEFPVKDFYNNRKTEIACGAGVIYDMEDGSEYSYILTNYHVVYYSSCATSNHIAKRINIYQYGGDESVYDAGDTLDGYPTYTYGNGAIEAEFIGGSLNYDLAVLKVKTDDLLTHNEYAEAVTLADDYNLGESAIAIGNPECEGFSVTSGIISVVSEDIQMTGADDITNCQFRVMRIDTAVNGGNSGGGLFNMNGELIGIVNAKAVSSDIDNIAYALPIDNVTKVANNLIYYYEQSGKTAQVKKLVLDIQYTTENSHAVYNPATNRTTVVDELKVAEVTLGGVGNLMGLHEGDVIKSISINGTVHNITRAYQLADWLLTIRTGDKIMLTVKRNNLTKELGIVGDLGILSTQLKVVE